jgi:hypothetical protein
VQALSPRRPSRFRQHGVAFARIFVERAAEKCRGTARKSRAVAGVGGAQLATLRGHPSGYRAAYMSHSRIVIDGRASGGGRKKTLDEEATKDAK